MSVRSVFKPETGGYISEHAKPVARPYAATALPTNTPQNTSEKQVIPSSYLQNQEKNGCGAMKTVSLWSIDLM